MMVYGHPFSSIQHPLEDPGMLTVCVIPRFLSAARLMANDHRDSPRPMMAIP